MNKYFKCTSLIMMLVATTGFLVSCSNDEFSEMNTVHNSPSKNINFTTTQEGVIGSRATAITGSNYLNTDLVPSMRVWGYFAHNAAEGDGVVAGGQYVGEYGQSITIDNHSQGATADWQYNDIDDLAYWPSQPLNFYAVIGAEDNKVVTRMSSTVGANKLTHVVADVFIPTDNADQKDIMFAKSVNQTREFNERGTDPVDFKFYHALSQIVFSGKVAAKKISAEVQSITICNVDRGGRIGYLTDDGSDVVLDSEVFEGIKRYYGNFTPGLIDVPTLNGTENKNTAKNLTAADGALIMLPQDRTSDKWATTPGTPVSIATADTQHQTYLKISCKIRYGDVFLVGSASNYSNVYVPFVINWEQGKKYTYTIIFGAGAGGYDEDGKPLDTLLPITYTASAPQEWDAVGPINVPELPAEATPVDLGLSVKWAAGNVGAENPEDTGLYFQWGETTGYASDAGHNFNWTNYKWSVDGSVSNFSKYNSTGATLDLEDDAAHVNLGGSWRMPTKAEIDELISGTTQSWTPNYENTGMEGYVITSKTNGNSIFMPAAGYCEGSSLLEFGSSGHYWSSSQDSRYSRYGCCLDSYTDGFGWGSAGRAEGYSVRAVCP